jgi:hypothetical protein
MEPPPTQELFDNMDDAVSFAKLHAERHGYALTRANLIRDKRKEVRRLDLRCDKGGKKRGEGIVRNTSTRMTECPFELRLYRINPESGLWKITVFDGSHNHRAADGPEQHAQYRRPTEEQTKQIGELAKAGVAPRFIVNYLHQQNSDSYIASRDVYNTKAKLKKQRLQEYTPIEALVNEIAQDEERWCCRYSTGSDGHVNFFFFANALSIDLIQSYPDVILIDATYRTNRYNMPLLHFLGVTAINTTFSIAFCFLSAEDEGMYDLAVKAFKEKVLGNAPVEVFLTDDETNLKSTLKEHFPDIPQLLCLWHVHKNVQTQAQKLWRINTTSEQENEANKEKRKAFMGHFKKARSYTLML